MVKILKKVEAKAYCEHCNNEFETVWLCRLESVIGTRYALLCSGCQKLIGIYSSPDFMGSIINSNITFDELKVI